MISPVTLLHYPEKAKSLFHNQSALQCEADLSSTGSYQEEQDSTNIEVRWHYLLHSSICESESKNDLPELYQLLAPRKQIAASRQRNSVVQVLRNVIDS